MDCSKGTYSNSTGVSVACGNLCPQGRFANTTGRTSLDDCQRCRPGRFIPYKGAAVSQGLLCPPGRTSLLGAAACDILTPCPAISAPLQERGVGIVPGSQASLYDNVAAPSSTVPKFGDTLALACNDGSTPTGTRRTTCGVDGKWVPDPLDINGNPTICDRVACPALGLGDILGVFVSMESTADLALNVTVTPGCDPSCTKEITLAIAVSNYELRCPAEAVMLVAGAAPDDAMVIQNVPPRVTCLTTGLWNTSSVIIDNIRCQCAQGSRKGGGDQATQCLQCPDKTYAPVNTKNERVEVRAC